LEPEEEKALMKTIPVAVVLATVLCCGAGCPDRQCQDELAELKAERDLLEANKVLVLRTHEEVWSNGNLGVIDELYSEDYVGHWVSGEDSDREALKRIVSESLSAFPDKTEEVVHIVAEGDLVVSHFIAAGTVNGEIEGAETEGKRISRPEIAIHRVVDGKIVEQWTVADQLTLMQQLGLM
jgi:steroid delta-isomerase-like uncharacterized protein